jgi:hypothetical protein
MNEGQAMRDIRGDLQDRAALLEEQINAHEAQFEKLIEQLKREQDSRVEDLKAELEAVNRLMEVELRRLETAPFEPKTAGARARGPSCPSAASTRSASAAASSSASAHPGTGAGAASPSGTATAFADFLIRKLNEAGAMPRDDLRRLALQEGYFIDAETADRGVHATLINVVKAGLIRQLPNGNFAPATVLDTIRLRRAM